MGISMVVISTSFIFSLIMAIIYFLKRQVVSYEVKIYNVLIVLNFFSLILEFWLGYNVFSKVDLNSINNVVINYLFLITLFIWFSLFVVYVFFNLFQQSKNTFYQYVNKQKNKMLIIFISYIIFGVLLLLFLANNNSSNLLIGINFSILRYILIFYIMLCIFFILVNFRSIPIKKYSLIIFSIIIFLGLLISKYVLPNILLDAFLVSLVTFLLYFNLENSDLGMISELNIAKEQAEKANNAKTDFLSSMSHEIRTPLNAIVGFAQALSEEDIKEDTKDEVKDIISASETLLEIVNGILDISKIEANKLEIINTEYSFWKVYNESVSLAKSRIGDKSLEFRNIYDLNIPPTLYGDKLRIKQVILNLLTNAIKYTEEGFIEFKVSSIKKDDICRIVISVEDSGIGIPEDKMGKLFNKFERLDIDNDIKAEGTGLGLAITKKLLDLMNGQIVVQSTYGQGSKFTVAIDQKIVPTNIVNSKETDVVDETKYIGKKVLIVDDNFINLKVAERLLKKYEIDIDTASSGEECLNIVKNNGNYDLILLDDMMPKMSGVETYKNLLSLPNFNTPTVALTANAIVGMKEKYLQEGFSDYISKPIEKSELERVVRKFLNK